MARVGTDLREDVAAARRQMRRTVGGGREIRHLIKHLREGERVQAMAVGAFGGGMGLLTFTDRRLLFTLDRLLSQVSEDFPLDKVGSVQWASGLFVGTITIYASGNRAQIVNVNTDDGQRLVGAARERLSPGQAPAPEPAPVRRGVPAADESAAVTALLRELGKLRDDGVVTFQEFEAKKADLLARL